MKTVYFFRTLAVVLLAFLVTSVTAKEIRVPANGTDSDIANALEQAANGDVILISGWISFEAPVTIEKNVTFRNDAPDGNAGFDGMGETKIFEMAPEAIEGAKLVFYSLGFVGGNNADDGGVGRIVKGTVEFYDCFFEDNKTANRGGALYLAEEGTIVRFFGCEATGNQSTRGGGFLFSTGHLTTEFTDCKISRNKNLIIEDSDVRGGAFTLRGGYHRFFHCIIDSNTSGNPDATSGEEKGGGAFFLNGDKGESIKSFTMESCAITNNIAYGNHGSAFFITTDDMNMTLINTTIARNTTKSGAGSWFLATSNIDITLVNVTLANNEGTNVGNAGGGIRVMNPGNRINILNSILVRNYTIQDNVGVDMRFSATANIAKDIVFKNSIVGLISGIPDDDIRAAQDNPNIPTKSRINMYRLNGEDGQAEYIDLDESGIDFAHGLQVTQKFAMPYYSLYADAYAAKLGDPNILFDCDTQSDQLQVDPAAPRKIAADGSIYAGAVQVVAGNKKFEETYTPDYTAIKAVTLPQDNRNIRIIGAITNGMLGVDYGDLKGRAKGELIATDGRVVEKVFDLNVFGKGYYNVKTTVPGLYLLRVTIDGKAYTQRVILK